MWEPYGSNGRYAFMEETDGSVTNMATAAFDDSWA